MPIDEGINGVVASDSYMQARSELRAPLPDDNRTGGHRFTGKGLDAQALACAVSTVSGGTATFFVCHLDDPVCRRDAGVSYFAEIFLIVTDVTSCL